MTIAKVVAELKQVANADYEDILAILSGKEISEPKCEEDFNPKRLSIISLYRSPKPE